MYYLAKMLQIGGMTIILIDFLRHFPELMSRLVLCIGVGLFVTGWAINKFLLRQ